MLSYLDYAILLVIGLAVVCAFRSMKKNKGCHSCGSCKNCSKCSHKTK